MIDVADYKHIPFGPGIMLIAFEGNFSIGYEEHGFGLSYNRKISFRESEEKSLHKIKNILDNVVDLILNEESLREEIQFLNEYILYSNDRYEFPNNLENGNKLKQLAVSSFDKPIISSLNNNTKNRLSINIKEVNNECKISTSNG
jgi:hypothetical protein